MKALRAVEPAGRKSARISLWVAAGSLLAALSYGEASAQAPPASPTPASLTDEEAARIRAERDQVFQALQSRPDDLDLLFRYAQLSQAIGDLEAAAASYERMLIYNPDLPRVRLELALLYYRLGSYQQSRAYLDQVLGRADLPPQVRRNAEQLLAAISQQEETAPGMRFYGALFGAIRWQDNANAGPDSRLIDIGGLDFVLNEEATGQEDFSLLLSGRLGNFIPITESVGWRSGAQAVYADYFELDQLDQIVLRLDTGPQLVTSAANRQLTFWPHALVEHYRLGGDAYYTAYGGGLDTTFALSRTTALILEIEGAYRDYDPSAGSTAIDLRDGTVLTAEATVYTALENGFTYSASAEYGRTDADAGFYSADRWGVMATAAYEFDPGFGIAPGEWRVGARGEVRWDDYDDPDPVLNPTEAREDTLYSVGGYVTVPVFENASLLFDADWRDVDSNYALYDYSATTLLMGLRYEF